MINMGWVLERIVWIELLLIWFLKLKVTLIVLIIYAAKFFIMNVTYSLKQCFLRQLTSICFLWTSPEISFIQSLNKRRLRPSHVQLMVHIFIQGTNICIIKAYKYCYFNIFIQRTLNYNEWNALMYWASSISKSFSHLS